MPIDKDTGVVVDPAEVINEILAFAAQGVDGRDLLAQADYAADAQRLIGHQPGIARQELANKQARQAAHMAAGLAQFLARRYAAGVVDDGDLDKVEAGIVAAVYALIGPSLPGLAKVGTPGIVMPDGTTITVDATGKISSKAQSMDPVGGIRFFEDEAPRAGYVPCLGTTISNFSTTYPEMAAYLSTTYGAARLVTLAQYNALHTATWATLADGSTVGWNGIGGVTKFVWDKDADTLKMPDLQEMFRSSTGASLGVGGVQGDVSRQITGGFKVAGTSGGIDGSAGVFYTQGSTNYVETVAGVGGKALFDTSRVVPVGPANAPRRWGALACCYLGPPAS